MMHYSRAIFVDSTISHAELTPYIIETDLLCPGIRRGDLIQLLNDYDSIKTVIIVDGVFEQQPSITHKEILWTIGQGIEVIGVSSIGALRAYELLKYGMKGFGDIFQSYLSNSIDGDDEVAISYFSNKGEFSKTIALVNIRSTLKKLNYSNEGLINQIRKIHYKNRNWEKIKGIVPIELFLQLKEHYIDQKKKDLLSLLKEGQPYRGVNVKETFYQNIFFTKELVEKKYTNIIAFIDNNLKKLPLISSYHFDVSTKQNACEIATYLKVEKSYINTIASILSSLHPFKYCSTKCANISKTIRVEQKLYKTEDLINFINQNNIPQTNLPQVYEGIAKLYDYFLINQPARVLPTFLRKCNISQIPSIHKACCGQSS